jgi:thioredoxin-related protein
MKNLIILLSLFLTLTPELDWKTDFQEAKELSKASDKKILLVFSGSDWCKPCIQLHRSLFETEEFAAYAKDHLVLLKADFPSQKKNQLSKEQTAKNEALAAQYNPNGEFPLAVFLDDNGKVLGSFGFDKTKTPVTYIKEFEKYLK